MPTPKDGALIVGAGGFLGGYLAKELMKSGKQVFGVDRKTKPWVEGWSGYEVRPCEDVIPELIRALRPAEIYYLAGSADVGSSVVKPFDDFASLLPGWCKLLEAVKDSASDASILLFSSAAVYGASGSGKVSERSTLAPLSPYGAHKKAAEYIAADFARIFALRVSVLRIFSAYGPGLRRQLFWDVAAKVREARRTGQSAIQLRGTGQEVRDFIHATDVARIASAVAARASDEPPRFRVLNAASGRSISVERASKILLQILAPEMSVEFTLPMQKGDPPGWEAKIDALRTIYPRELVRFEEGAKDLGTWLRAEFDL